MPARIVPPTAFENLNNFSALDFLSELRTVVVGALDRTLDSDAIEAITCTACEVIEDGDAVSSEVLRAALQVIFNDSGLTDVEQVAVLNALLATAGENSSTLSPQTTQTISVCKTDARQSPDLRWQRQADTERIRALAYLREQESHDAVEQLIWKKHEQELAKYYTRPIPLTSASSNVDIPHGNVGSDDILTGSSDSESDEDDEATRRDRQRVQQRLREFGEPATLFGEDDAARVARLQQCELYGNQDVLASGSTNVMHLISHCEKRGIDVDHDDEDENFQAALPDGPDADAVGADTEAHGTGSNIVKDNAGTDGAARAVVGWIRKTLGQWEASLLARASNVRDQSEFRTERAQFRQTRQYLRPLRKSLRRGSVEPDVVASLGEIVECCRDLRYRDAKEAYLRLAIGSSRWPIGVTNVTFHDRPARHNIGEDAVAHVLDDETTRKYIQMVKRLLSFCEVHSPVDASVAE